MIWVAVADEILATVAQKTGVSIGDWGDAVPSPPAAILAMPERVDYSMAGRRGGDRIPDAELVLVTGPPNTARSLQLCSAYADGTGDLSVPQALDERAGAWTSCTDVRPVYAEMAVVTYKGTDLQAVIFHLDIGGDA